MRPQNEPDGEARQAAADYLAERGFAILDRNWQSPDGEIPILAEESGILVAVHVVTRMSGRYHDPLERAGKLRRARLRRAAVRWLKDHGMRRDQIRVDIIGLRREDSGFAIEHTRAVG